MKKYAILTGLLILMTAVAALAQDGRGRPDRRGGTIVGMVRDATYDLPIEYGNIVLSRAADSTQITGTVTNAEGRFELQRVPPGRYYIEARFIGYHTKRTETISVRPQQSHVDVGTIALESTVLTMEDVMVEDERAAITYQIDKKVIEVSQQQTVISGTAVDVLENLPSITVDIEGNVSLRGSGNFTVLIDGRPTILEPSEALQQIPASSIDTIELITNPSAKYDPEGTAGIINIILKKKEQQGRSLTVNMNAGWDDKYGADVLLEQKTENLQATLGVDFNRRHFTGEDLEENQTTIQGLTSFVNSEGNSLRGRTSVGLRGELQFVLTPKNIVTFGGRFGDRTFRSDADLNYNAWTEGDPDRLRYASVTDRQRSGYYYAVNMHYQHLFNQRGHEFTADLHFDRGEGEEETKNELLNENGTIVSGQRSTEAGPDMEFRARLDYVHPFGEDKKFEAGYQGEIELSEERSGLFEYDPEQDRYLFIDEFSNATDYDEREQALYALFGGEWGKIGFQGGLRGEYTYRVIDFSGERFTIDRWDFFPTVHASYQFSETRQVMASYTRRIDRPRGWYLEPFETWTDAYNVRVGNPALEPEFIDSYEAGFQTHVGKHLFSSEAYYRVNHNKIERVRSVYAENVTLHSFENVGTDYAFGSELFLDLGMTRLWNLALMGDLYHYRIEGQLFEESFSRESFNWRLRVNNVFKFNRATQLQINGRYNSPSVSSQGRREGFFVVDAALRRDFFNRRVTATLQVRDLLGTAEYEYTTSGADFYTYRYANRESPIVMLNLRYNLNQQRPDRRRDADRNQDDFEVDF